MMSSGVSKVEGCSGISRTRSTHRGCCGGRRRGGDVEPRGRGRRARPSRGDGGRGCLGALAGGQARGGPSHLFACYQARSPMLPKALGILIVWMAPSMLLGLIQVIVVHRILWVNTWQID